jgi:hypothetical protein
MNSALVEVRVAPALAGVVAQLQALHETVLALPDLKTFEKTVHEELKRIDRLVMEELLVEKIKTGGAAATHEVRCRHCASGWAVMRELEAPRYAVTVRGRVDFTRPVYRCDQADCARERIPVDEELGLAMKSHYTRGMENKIAWAGTTESSFVQASKQMEHQVEIAVSPSEIQRVIEQVGRRGLALQDAEVKQRGAPASLDSPIATAEQPETVVIEMDGTCVMGRDGTGHEVKCATVFGLDARAVTGSPGKERPVLLRRCYCATSHGIRPFGAMVWALASWWGVRSARRVVVIGDGGDWIWNYSRDRLHFTLPDGRVVKPVEILDFYHAAENLGKARDDIFADGQSVPAKAWFDQWRQRLRQGEVDAVIEELDRRTRAAKDRKRRDALRVRKNYFSVHRERMRYPEYEALGLPIGSGAIEGTCKSLVKGRMDGVGMRWDVEEGIELMTALRVRLFNDRWEDLWSARQDPDAQAA